LTQELHADHAKRYHSDSGSPKDRRPDRAGKDGSQADRVLRPKEMPKQHSSQIAMSANIQPAPATAFQITMELKV
jgi:hypothetical protein